MLMAYTNLGQIRLKLKHSIDYVNHIMCNKNKSLRERLKSIFMSIVNFH